MKFRKILHRKIDKDTEYIDFVFTAERWSGLIKNMEKDKCNELIWCNEDKLPDNLLDFEKYIINHKDMVLFFGWED